MNLTASLIVKDEMARFLPLAVANLQEFCDTVVALDDHSTDGSYEFLEQAGVRVKPASTEFFAHEGLARQELLFWTLQHSPTHILAIDADEVVANGQMLRFAIDQNPRQEIWTLEMQEIWKADENQLWIRIDGGWRPHQAPVLYKVKRGMGGIKQVALSCGREPEWVRKSYGRGMASGTEVLHLGWLRESERAARYARYVTHDAGKFHAQSHLKSIMWEDRRVRLKPRSWPSSLGGLRVEMTGVGSKV